MPPPAWHPAPCSQLVNAKSRTARAHVQVFNTTSGQPLRLAATSRQTAEVLPINATSCSWAVIAHIIDAVSAGSARRRVHRAGWQAMCIDTACQAGTRCAARKLSRPAAIAAATAVTVCRCCPQTPVGWTLPRHSLRRLPPELLGPRHRCETTQRQCSPGAAVERRCCGQCACLKSSG